MQINQSKLLHANTLNSTMINTYLLTTSMLTLSLWVQGCRDSYIGITMWLIQMFLKNEEYDARKLGMRLYDQFVHLSIIKLDILVVIRGPGAAFSSTSLNLPLAPPPHPPPLHLTHWSCWVFCCVGRVSVKSPDKHQWLHSADHRGKDCVHDSRVFVFGSAVATSWQTTICLTMCVSVRRAASICTVITSLHSHIWAAAHSPGPCGELEWLFSLHDGCYYFR